MSDEQSTQFNYSRSKLIAAAFLGVVILSYTPERRLAAIATLSLVPIAIAYGLWRLARYNRLIGVPIIFVVVITVGIYSVLFYQAEARYSLLASKLDHYSKVNTQQKFIPLPYVYSLSINRGKTDDKELAEILRLDGLERVTHLYLESNHLTDSSLEQAARIQHLKYIFIDCKEMTNDAIVTFRDQHPGVSVIAYKRELDSDNPIKVFLGPLPD